jgi:hypothetical protein
MGKKSGSGSGMNDWNHISEILEIRDRKNSDPGSKKFGSGIRDKHPGSATLISNSRLHLALLVMHSFV